MEAEPAYSPAPLQMMSMRLVISCPVSEVEQMVGKAVNSTQPEDDSHSCPNLYTRVGDRCLSLFTLAKYHFPDTIYNSVPALTTNFWIGGKYNSSTSAWAWASDDTPMPLGSPFWAVRYNTECVPRPPPQTDPFSAPPDAEPGAPCHHYLQAPRTRAQGWCSAMTYEHHYYIIDEECQNAHSPLCVLTREFYAP
ncbi:uncharacterized protein LOC122261716 [Penaeus japonicus]|uniref:uncharacterized protein LOC122261716 n=1 Tax=Penaeus japonicus TaxID=27405 RepID=UPI001C70E705|nr:uncharacterized protein LOC122261716 [Penaeus japonicus]